jgi:hypothetical protein
MSFTHRAWKVKFNFVCHHHRHEAHIESSASTQDTEIHLEPGDAREGARSTQRRCGLGSQKHTWTVWEQCAVDEGAFGGYDCKKHTRRIRRSSIPHSYRAKCWKSTHCLIKPDESMGTEEKG